MAENRLQEKFPRPNWHVVRPRFLPLSLRLDRRVPLAVGVLLLATMLFLVLSVCYGEYSIAPLDVLRAET